MMRGRGGFGANESPEIMVERMLLMGDWDGDDRISRDEAKISVEEAPDAVRQRFERMDANGDGFLDQREIQAMMSGRGRQQR